MSKAKYGSKRKRFKKAAPVFGAAAGLSLSLASGASAGLAAVMPTPSTGAGHEIILAEEEISDVSLATFYVFDKENAARPYTQLARGGCGGGGGCGCRGCGGGGACGCAFRGCGGGGFGGCSCFRACGGCAGCLVCAACAGWWGGCGIGACTVGSCCISLGRCGYC
jgi:hypothetical protein